MTIVPLVTFTPLRTLRTTSGTPLSVTASLIVPEISPEYIKTNVKSKDKEFENLIPENILAEQKLEKETKEKRKKEHFFHGKIKFNT